MQYKQQSYVYSKVSLIYSVGLVPGKHFKNCSFSSTAFKYSALDTESHVLFQK